MSEHVPTETEIKLTYMLGVHGNNPTVTASDASGEFDRWLEAHDREVAAKALRDFAESLKAGPAIPLPPSIFVGLAQERAQDIEAGDPQ